MRTCRGRSLCLSSCCFPSFGWVDLFLFLLLFFLLLLFFSWFVFVCDVHFILLSWWVGGWVGGWVGREGGREVGGWGTDL